MVFGKGRKKVSKDKDSRLDDIPGPIQRALREMMAERGDCPGSEKLIAFHDRLLPAEEILQVRQHVEMCGLCDSRIAAMARFDSVTKPTEEKDRLMIVRRFFLSPALAYLFVLALIYPAYRGIFQEPEVKEKIVTRTKTIPMPVEAVAAARDFSLGEATRQRSGGVESIPIIELSPQEKFFILSFFLPVHPSHQYEMEITDDKGGVLTSADRIMSRDALGNFSIVASSKLFPDNLYTLKVLESEEGSGRLIDTYSFPFQVTHRQP